MSKCDFADANMLDLLNYAEPRLRSPKITRKATTTTITTTERQVQAGNREFLDYLLLGLYIFTVQL